MMKLPNLYMKNNEHLLEDSIFCIGKVVSVDGRKISIEVDKLKNTSHLVYRGDLLKNISVGGYIKIIKGFTKIIGKVEGEFVNEDRIYSKKEYGNRKQKINRILNISLLGFFNGKGFERGIKELPLIDNECFLLQKSEFNQIHNFVEKDDEPIEIGALALEKGEIINVGINSLFASHIGIFGNTGSGKSYTLAKIYTELFKKFKDKEKFKDNANFLFIDFNGEYIGDDVIVEKAYKNIYKLSTKGEGEDKFPIEKSVIYEPEFWTVLAEATEKTQSPFLRRALSYNLIADYGQETFDFSVNEKIVSMVQEIIEKKDKNLGIKIFLELFSELFISAIDTRKIDELKKIISDNLQFNGTNSSYYIIGLGGEGYKDPQIKTHFLDPIVTKIRELNYQNSIINAMRLKILIKYYDEIIKGHSNKDHLSPLIKRIDSRIKDLQKVIMVTLDEENNNHKNITVVSLKNVNINIRKIFPMLLCKKFYDDKKMENDETKYLNIIIDEAHNILSINSERESEQWKDYRLETFEEIIKEGRKFGTFLTIASQRPSDISDTIISQLHNYFLHRLINNNDIYAVEKTVSFLDKVSFEYLPILPTGTCIMAGLLAQIPVVVDVGIIEEKYIPRNKTMTLISNWQ
jgi:DNA helicase HerA-like ATPase